MAVLQDININVYAQPSDKRLRTFLSLSQNENGRLINFRILGSPLPSNCTAVFSGTKPDGNVYSKAGTVAGNFVIVQEDIQMTAVAGVWDAKLDIINGSHNIMTAMIRVMVERGTVAPGSVPSNSQLDGYVAQCKSYAEHARTDAYGSPLTATTAAEMTDKTRVYVYTGSESGMTAGNWYTWNGSAWVSGGVYNAVAVQTDTTLSVAGKAADAKETGDQISAVKEDLKNAITQILDSSYYLATNQIIDTNIVVDENINTDTGIRNTNVKRSRTVLIDKGVAQIVEFATDTYQFQVLSYGANGNLTNGTDYLGKLTQTWTHNTIVHLPNETKKIGFIFKRSDDGDMSQSDVDYIVSALSLFAYTDKTLSKPNVPADAEEVGSILKDIRGRTKNELNVNDMAGATIELSNGELSGTASAFSNAFANGIPIDHVFEENTQYTLSFDAYCTGTITTGNGLRFVVKYTDDSQNIKNIPNSTRTYEHFTYTTASNKTINYIGMGVGSGASNTWYLKAVQIEKGNKATEYVPYYSATDYTARDDNTELERNTVKYPLSKFYHANNDVTLSSSYSDVIAKYDELVTLYPNYITKNNLSVGNFTNYEYVLTFGNYNAKETRRAKDSVIAKPKILICSGVHGYERSSVMGLYTLVKSLCESEFSLHKIIGNTIIKIIPIVCPWGYDNNSRLNENGVNINRNFASSDWTLTPQGDNYSGASAGDQPETQVVQNWIDANTDAMLMLDWHNSQYVNEISCLLSENTDALQAFKKKYLQAIESVIPYWQIDRGLDNSKVYAYTATSTATGTTKSYALEKGLIAGTLETSWNIGNTGQDSAETIGTNAEVTGNLLIGLKSYYTI